MRFTKSTAIRMLFALLTAAPFVPAHAAALVVVASIKPLGALAAAVMEGVGAPDVLIKGAASPHTYSLRPSDRRLLDDAALVIWVGPGLETFLERPLSTVDGAKVITATKVSGLKLLPAREGGLWDEEPGHNQDHRPAGIDPHLWLDIGNTKVIVRAIAERLSALDPGNAAIYSRNAGALGPQFDALDAELRMKLAPVAGKPFIVFHDATHYFEARYGLTAAGAITVSPDRIPGAGRIAAIKRRVADAGAACVFSEPPFQPKLAAMLISGTSAKSGMLDAEGVALDPGPALYFKLMRQLADNLVGCLAMP